MYDTEICKECIASCQDGHISCPCETGDCEYEWEMQASEGEF